MSVTPFGMLSCAQPDSSATAGSASAPAAAVRTRRASVLRIVILLPYRPPPLVRREKSRSVPSSPDRGPSPPGGRLVDAANDPRQAQGESAPLLFGQKAAQLALATVRLDGEPARVQACGGAAKFNLCPMPREHDPLAPARGTRFDADVRLRDGDGLGVEAPLERDLERPGEERDLESGERQDRPEALECEEASHAEGHDAGAREEHARTAHGEGAVRTDLDREWRGVHGNAAMVARSCGDSNQAGILPLFVAA